MAQLPVGFDRATTDRKRVLNEYPYCVYCGGENPATTVDHIPPTGMFPKRDRPPGLFVPSCEVCNRNSRVVDDIAAFFTAIRMGSSEDSARHLAKQLQAMSNNHPEVLIEGYPTIGQLRVSRQYADETGQPFGAINMRGPIISRRVYMFGAKCGLALHYNAKRQALPSNGKVGVLWYTNFDALKNEVPQHLFKLLPERRSLGKGRRTAHGTFEFNSATTIDGNSTAHWATFGDAFMFNLFVGVNIRNLDDLPSDQVYQPGSSYYH